MLDNVGYCWVLGGYWVVLGGTGWYLGVLGNGVMQDTVEYCRYCGVLRVLEATWRTAGYWWLLHGIVEFCRVLRGIGMQCQSL